AVPTRRSSDRVVDRAEVAQGALRVGGAALHGERALAGGGEDLFDLEHVGDVVEAAHPVQSRVGQHDRVEFAGGDLAQAGLGVAADRHVAQVGAERRELGDAARRAGADGGSGRQVGELQPVAGAQGVPGVVAFGHGGEHDAVGGGGGQVLEGVDG